MYRFFSNDEAENKRIAITAAARAHWKDLDLVGSNKKEADQMDSLVWEYRDNDDLHRLGWLRSANSSSSASEGIWRQYLVNHIRTMIREYTQEVLLDDESFARDDCSEQILNWCRSNIVWKKGDDLSHLVGGDENPFGSLVDEIYVEIRSGQLFEIVADYPDSNPAVEELRIVISRMSSSSGAGTSPHNRSNTVSIGHNLRQALQNRLCHPGASTNQIIEMYVSMIGVMRQLDPSDRLLEYVAEPVRTYLRKHRPDTVRSIVLGLVQGNDVLGEELRRTDAQPLEDRTGEDEDDDRPPTLDWQPQPSILQQRGTFLEGTGVKTDSGDILAILVSIYGSKDLFVNEYRKMLADKLLQNMDYNTDQEVHTLELLKLRFGETSMRSCEIMIKDMDDSKRANTNIHSTRKDSCVDAVMLSHIFWPSLQNETLKHHPRLQQHLNNFGDAYFKLKNPRKLNWIYQLGSVELDLDVISDSSDRVVVTKTFTCSPLQATLLQHFEDKDCWTSDELSNETCVPEHVIQKRMSFWINNRVVKLVSDVSSSTYKLLCPDDMESEHSDPSLGNMYMDFDIEEEEAAVSEKMQEEQEMEVFLSYIVGMLSNLGQLPLKTIHSNLKTFVTGSDVRYDKSPQQLSTFLQQLCREEKIELGADGMYRLFKK